MPKRPEKFLTEKAKMDRKQATDKKRFEKFVEENFDVETFDISAKHGFRGNVKKKTKFLVGEGGKSEFVQRKDLDDVLSFDLKNPMRRKK